MAYVNQTTRALDGLSPTLEGLRTGLVARLAWYRNYRRTLDELSMLSDRDLADLGMHRSLIREIARDAADQA